MLRDELAEDDGTGELAAAAEEDCMAGDAIGVAVGVAVEELPIVA
jgi:hypothetical protein